MYKQEDYRLIYDNNILKNLLFIKKKSAEIKKKNKKVKKNKKIKKESKKTK
jgi:hypothetical protein